MKKISMTPGALLMLAMLTACSTAPKATSLLDSTRQHYLLVQNNPKIALLAPLEMQQATEAMSLANQAASNNEADEVIDRLSKMAQTKIATAEEAAKQKNAENSIVDARKQRDEIRLSQRTVEANQQKDRAEQAELSADAANVNTINAQQRVLTLSFELAELKAKNTDRGIVITIGDLLFGSNDSRLKPEGIRELQKLANVLQTHQQQTILVEGHTDNTGTVAYNLTLSEHRSNAVSSALQLMGVARNRIFIHGYGEEFPVVENTTPENRQLNRRVEIVMSDMNGKIIGR
ncbi:OmpA family protein [Undibacterium sp. SXout20W]|uniref:OmpA family protein n=1 Tax=Undibacterium sp. SXout20W TaxID=3413051 RepID=UPI003BF0FF6A